MIVGNNRRVEPEMVRQGVEHYNCINCIMNEVLEQTQICDEITSVSFSLIWLFCNLSFSCASLLGQVWLCLVSVTVERLQ